jgi:pimeloyl-ACP methyl ester carboxylesterase
MQCKPLLIFLYSIVAVHGLGGGWDTTWTAENGKFWLRDFLLLDLPRACIMSYGYNAHTAFSKAVTDISDVAISLLDRLDHQRQPHKLKRPVIFISHSLGGIIVKKVLKLLLCLGVFPEGMKSSSFLLVAE